MNGEKSANIHVSLDKSTQPVMEGIERVFILHFLCLNLHSLLHVLQLGITVETNPSHTKGKKLRERKGLSEDVVEGGGGYSEFNGKKKSCIFPYFSSLLL